MSHPNDCYCHECIGCKTLTTGAARTVYAFLRWLKDTDAGVGLCWTQDNAEDELTPSEWEEVLRRWELHRSSPR